MIVLITFYSGFKANTVTQYKSSINKVFPNATRVSKYTNSDITRIIKKEKIIKHRPKIEACVENAKKIKAIQKRYKKHNQSFQAYVDDHCPDDSLASVLMLREVLMRDFKYISGITSWHLLMDMGYSVLKPDMVICRTFYRLGLLESEQQIFGAIMLGIIMSQQSGKPIRYIDKILVAHGQAATEELGIKRGICGTTPQCQICKAEKFCKRIDVD
jgi:DNA-3-methyladenine glycosylase I